MRINVRGGTVDHGQRPLCVSCRWAALRVRVLVVQTGGGGSVPVPLAPGCSGHPPGPHPAADAALNGKIERSHRVDDEEFYPLLDRDDITDDIHLFNEKLREWKARDA